MGLETGDVRRGLFEERCAKLKKRINGRKGKGCDIGYALASNSCEGVANMDTCTVTALDAIAAFAVPNPTCPSQSSWFFRVRSLCRSPCRADHPAYFGLAKFYLSQPFQPSTVQMLSPRLPNCQRQFLVQLSSFVVSVPPVSSN